MSPLHEIALQNAIKEIGTQEEPKGSNWGKRVQQYLASIGINSPAPWCMAFVYFCFDEASKQLQRTNPLVRTGLVLGAWNKAKINNGRIKPEPGDIFIMDFGGGTGHTGIVEKVEGLWIYTVEGNTNDEGGREGYEVCRKRRLLSKVKGYLRYT